MSWVKELKQQVQEVDNQQKELENLWSATYLRLTPLIVGILNELGQEWYGKFLSVKKYKIETLPDVYFWGITRRGKGMELLPQRLYIKLRAFENNDMYFSLEVAFTDGPTLSANTADISEESLKKAIIDLITPE